MKNKEESRESLHIEPASLPKGGGAYKGLGEELHTDLFTGNIDITIPVYTSPCRDSEPKLELKYHSTTGNGLWGLGFSLDLPHIERKTSIGIPKYIDEEDVYLSSSYGELTLSSNYAERNGYKVYSYLPVVDKPQYQIEFWKSSFDSYWKVISGENQVFLYGVNDNSRVIEPQGQIFAWLLTETTDCKGNRIRYNYEECNSNRYIQSIWYGNYGIDSKEDFCFEVRFSYENEDLTVSRKDCFTSYRSGFPICIDRLCRRIQMIHHFNDREQTVRCMKLTYEEEAISLLTRVEEEAYAKLADGTTECKKVPPLELSYTRFVPQEGQFKKLQIPEEDNICIGCSPEYQFVDLYGEGIAGILYSDQTANLYYEPLGNGEYAMPRVLPQFPIDRDLRQEEYTLTSLEGNGIYDLVVEKETCTGYYESIQGEWSEFIAFEKYPNNFNKGCRESADVQGDRLQHMLFAGKRRLVYYPSKGKRGVGEPIITESPKDFPCKSDDEYGTVVTFLDILGDGLSHRVKVTNGTVEYWPNLGYGHFGDKRRIENAPYITDSFDARRIYFADIDGSGTQDIAYVFDDRIEIYRNQGGRCFQKPFSIQLPEAYTNQDKISFVDINGCGYTSLVFTKMGVKISNYLLDFNQGKKPYLLACMDNHMGYSTKIEYSSSVKHYLEDKRRGIRWESIPPFPVFIADKIEQINGVTGLCITQNFHYRNGYYDTMFREFCGFGYIEESRQEKVNNQFYEGPKQYTRYWYYNGQNPERNRSEFYSGDRLAYEMPDSQIHSTNATSYTQAVLALKGNLIRKEVYDQTDTSKENLPISVEEIMYEVWEKIRAGNKRGAYWIQERERIQYIYDACVDDPRIKHTFLLDVDDYGNIENKLSVYYPRRKKGIAEQETGYVYLEQKKSINDVAEKRMIGADYITKLYEIGGFEFVSTGVSFHSAYSQTHTALMNIVPYLTELSDSQLQARIEQWSCCLYWDDEQCTQLPEGQIGAKKLVHHMEKAVFPEGLLDSYNSVQEEYLSEDGGYIRKDGYWWNRGLVSSYDANMHYLLIQEENCFVDRQNALYQSCRYEYDSFSLMPVTVIQWEKEESQLITRYRINYEVLKYEWMQDVNDNIYEVLYDPLGMIAATSKYGFTNQVYEGSRPLEEYVKKEGSFDQIILDKEAYIQNALQYYYYDLFAYEKYQQPIPIIELSNEGLSDSTEAGIRCKISYYDGVGREVLQKQCDDKRYCASQQIFYNMEEKEIIEYPPYFSDVPYYETPIGKQPYKVTYYDVVQRETKVVKAFACLEDGSMGTVYSKTEYTPWEINKYDENDTVLDSEYYSEFMKQKPEEQTIDWKDKMEALNKASAFCQTPDLEHLDCIGNKCRDYLDPTRESYVTYSYNSENKVIAMISYEKGQKGHITILTTYTMLGEVLSNDTSDSGNALVITDIYNRPVHTWDARDNHITYHYDHLGRQSQIWIDGIGLVEERTYGQAREEYRTKNCVGQLITQYDQAGIQAFEQYSIFGKPYTQCRTFRKGYEQEVSWSDHSLVEMESECYTESFTYNLLQEVQTQVTPGKEKVEYQYNGRGLLVGISLLSDQESESGTISLEYAPNGLQSRRQYGNGYCTEYCYQPITMLLEEIRTTDSSGKILQDLQYYHDPVENITRIRDTIASTVYHNQQITEGGFAYTYDERYQLIQATGREMPKSASVADYEKLETYMERYSYDPAGNIVGISHKAPSTNWNRRMETDEHSNRLVKSDDKVFQYDAVGNLIQVPEAQDLVWNARNQLVKATIILRDGEDSDAEYYVYDSTGNRVRKVTKRKTASGIEVIDKRCLGIFERKMISQNQDSVFLDRSTIHIGVQEKALLTYYCWRIDERSRETCEQGSVRVHYVMDNHLNSVCIETSDDGRILTIEEYYPFGSTAVSFGEQYDRSLKEYRYCNKENDMFTGFYYYGYRYYYAVYGRMISADSMDYVEAKDNKTLNRYRYCENNPITYVDLDGHCVDRRKDKKDKILREVTKKCTKKDKANAEKFVRFLNYEEAQLMCDVIGLVPKKQGETYSRGAKWISLERQPRDSRTLGKPENYTYKVTITVLHGTTDWLNSKAIDFESIGDESKHTREVIIKSNEQGSYGVGVDLLAEFNRRVIGINPVKIR